MVVLIAFETLRRLCKYSMKMHLKGEDYRYVCMDPVLIRNAKEFLDCDEFSCPYCEVENDGSD